ncbi:hypothetical protein EIP86_005627 [Pleurotus ostreatoroseus]|nr:hypothetical protein EIP86_005627 [Pleurotus ostreatoroseus]
MDESNGEKRRRKKQLTEKEKKQLTEKEKKESLARLCETLLAKFEDGKMRLPTASQLLSKVLGDTQDPELLDYHNKLKDLRPKRTNDALLSIAEYRSDSEAASDSRSESGATSESSTVSDTSEASERKRKRHSNDEYTLPEVRSTPGLRNGDDTVSFSSDLWRIRRYVDVNFTEGVTENANKLDYNTPAKKIRPRTTRRYYRSEDERRDTAAAAMYEASIDKGKERARDRYTPVSENSESSHDGMSPAFSSQSDQDAEMESESTPRATPLNLPSDHASAYVLQYPAKIATEPSHQQMYSQHTSHVVQPGAPANVCETAVPQVSTSATLEHGVGHGDKAEDIQLTPRNAQHDLPGNDVQMTTVAPSPAIAEGNVDESGLRSMFECFVDPAFIDADHTLDEDCISGPQGQPELNREAYSVAHFQAERFADEVDAESDTSNSSATNQLLGMARSFDDVDAGVLQGKYLSGFLCMGTSSDADW